MAVGTESGKKTGKMEGKVKREEKEKERPETRKTRGTIETESSSLFDPSAEVERLAEIYLDSKKFTI